MSEDTTTDAAAPADPAPEAVAAPAAADPAPAAVESVVAEVVDYVEHEAAIAQFKLNEGLAWIKAKLDDGRVGMLSRFGDFRQGVTGS